MIYEFFNDTYFCGFFIEWQLVPSITEETCFHRPPFEVALKIVGN